MCMTSQYLTVSSTLSILMSFTWEKIPGPFPLYRTESDGKLGGAWERGYKICVCATCMYTYIGIVSVLELKRSGLHSHIFILSRIHITHKSLKISQATFHYFRQFSLFNNEWMNCENKLFIVLRCHWAQFTTVRTHVSRTHITSAHKNGWLE